MTSLLYAKFYHLKKNKLNLGSQKGHSNTSALTNNHKIATKKPFNNFFFPARMNKTLISFHHQQKLTHL